MTRTAAAAGSDSPGAPGGGGNEGDTFVVQRGRTVPTLSSVSSATDKEHLNQVKRSRSFTRMSNTVPDVLLMVMCALL